MSDERSPQEGLRARRRVQTRAEIGDAAISLFMRQGFAETTVDEIALAAGVSSRTFFRYFPTKEDAALRSHDVFDTSVAAMTLESGEPLGVLGAVEDMYQGMFRTLTPESTEELFLLQGLIAGQPSLRAAAQRRYRFSAQNLRRKIDVALAPTPGVSSLLIVETAGGTVSAALELWYSSWSESGVSLADTYSSCRIGLRKLFN